MRYLVRLANDRGYTPRDTIDIQGKIRKLLGSHEKIGNLRVSTNAIEFDLFADQADLEKSKTELESKVSWIITLRPIETRAPNRSEAEALREGVRLFNEERFWEAHEALEEIWHPATGKDREIIQGLILSAAAFVHYQKDETSVCISILGRSLKKLGSANDFRGINIRALRSEVNKMIIGKKPHLLKMSSVRTKATLQTP